jgi:hypothetical protein
MSRFIGSNWIYGFELELDFVPLGRSACGATKGGGGGGGGRIYPFYL